jgi:hypothetical protein
MNVKERPLKAASGKVCMTASLATYGNPVYRIPTATGAIYEEEKSIYRQRCGDT